MEEAWQVKCSSGWPEPPALMGFPPLSAGWCNEINMNPQQLYQPGVVQVTNHGVNQMLQDQSFPRTFHMELGKSGNSDSGNSFHSLMSGHSYNSSSELRHTPNSSLEFSRLSLPDLGNLAQSSSRSFTSSWISPIVANREIPSVASPLISTSTKASEFQNSIFGSVEAISRYSIEDNTGGIRGPSRRFGSSPLSWSAIQYQNNVASLNLPSNANMHGLIPQHFRGHPRPRVLCMNTAGELFVNEKGLLEILCSCHGLAMSVAKFCQHAGLSSTTPCDSIRMESGMTLSQWCKMRFTNLASGAPKESGQSNLFSTDRVSITSNASSFSLSTKNHGTVNSIEAYSALGRSEQLRKCSLYGQHPNFAGHASVEMLPASNAMDYDYERRDSGGNGLHLTGLTQDSRPIISEDNSLQVVKRNPEILNITRLHPSSNGREPNVASQLFSSNTKVRTKTRNACATFEPLGSKKISIQDKCISMGGSSLSEAFADKSHGSELKLGQPSQEKHSSPSDKYLPSLTVCSSVMPQQNQLSDTTYCSRELKRARLSHPSPLLEAHTSDKRPSHSNCGTTFYNSESEDLTTYATKDSSISLFLSHLTGGTGLANSSNKKHEEIRNVGSSIKCDLLSSRENFSWCIRNEIDEIGKVTSFNELDYLNKKGKFLGGTSDSSKNMVDNNEVSSHQIEDKRINPPLIKGQCRHSCCIDVGKSSLFSNHPFKSSQRGSDATSSKCGEMEILEDSCHHKNIVHTPEIKASRCTCFPVCPELEIPVIMSSTNSCYLSEASCLSCKQNVIYTDHLIDENARFLASARHENMIAKHEQESPFKMKPQHGRYCCLATMETHRCSCTDDLVEPKDEAYCNIHQNESDFHSVSNHYKNILFGSSHCQPGSGASYTCCNCAASAQGPSPCSTFSSYHVCSAKRHLCFRQRNTSIEASLDNKEYEKCIRNGGLPVSGKCCCAIVSKCMAGCSFCGSVNNADTNLNSVHDNEFAFHKGRRCELEQCTCFKKIDGVQNSCNTGFCRTAAGKIMEYSATSTENRAITSEFMSKESDGTLRASMPMIPASNQSGSSAPPTTEVSDEVNENNAQFSNVRTGMALHYSVFDEGSGIEKCSSSDEVPGTKACNIIDASSMSSQSCDKLVDELKYCRSSKQMRERNKITSECTDQENCQGQQLCGMWSLGKRKESSKHDKCDDTIPGSVFSLAHSESCDYTNGVKCILPLSKHVRVSMRPENILQGTDIVSSGYSHIKQKQTGFPSKLVNLKRLKNINLPSSNLWRPEGPKCSVPVEENHNILVKGRKDSAKGLNHLYAERPPKYMSLRSIVDSRNLDPEASISSKKPVVCGNSGIISGGELYALQKPAKIVPLNLVLKKARRCMSNHIEHKPSVISKIKCIDGKAQQCSELSSCKSLDDSMNHYLGSVNEVSSRCHFMSGMKSHFSKLDFRKGIKGTWYASINSRNCSMNRKCDIGDQWKMQKLRCSRRGSSSVEGDVCCVCGSSNNETINWLLECNRCMIRVHQACYGISKVPNEVWYCRPCKANSHDIVCVLCGYDGGAMTKALNSTSIVRSLLKVWNVITRSTSRKSVQSLESIEDKVLNPYLSELNETDCSKHVFSPAIGSRSNNVIVEAASDIDNVKQKTVFETSGLENKIDVYNSIIDGVFDPSVIQWVHVVCGLWTPGSRCSNVDTMNSFDVCNASPARKNIVCSLCNRPGGSCIGCRVSNCSIHFHPWCAHQKGLLQSEIDDEDHEKVGFYGRCMLHAKNNYHLIDNQPMIIEASSTRSKEWSCARTESFRGHGSGFFRNHHNSFNDGNGCIVSQVQINVWLHINGHKSCIRPDTTPECSDVEHDLRKEYIRYKLSKGWKHLVVYNSGIHDLGLYTSRFITRGAMVVEYIGEVVGLRVADKREIEYQSGRQLKCKSACYFFRIDKEHIIDATRKGGIARFVNHSCRPNCVAQVIAIKNEKKVVFFAERDINPGEEITYDYHFNREDEGMKIPCFCNSKYCRRYLN